MTLVDTLPCNDTPESVALFLEYPEDSSLRESAYLHAKRLCATCPILDECRENVLRMEAAGSQVFGVAGGLSPLDRAKPQRPVRYARDERELAPHGTYAAMRRHQRRGERLCWACAETRRILDQERAAKRRARRAQDARPVDNFVATGVHDAATNPEITEVA